MVSGSGANVATLTTLAPHPGNPVSTTIEPSVQRAAETALAGEKKSAALVAVSASTGAVLAAVSVNSGGFDQAIDGGFPPGSTFKVVTSSALIGHGLTPRSAASCPGTATVDGEVFHNAESETPTWPPPPSGRAGCWSHRWPWRWSPRPRTPARFGHHSW